MRICDYQDCIDAVQKYTDFFTQNVNSRAKEAWLHELYRLRPRFDVVDAAIRRCAENDTGPSWARLRAAIKVEQRLSGGNDYDAAESQSEAYREFCRKYKAAGLYREPLGELPEVPGDRITTPEAARIHWRVIRKIHSGKLRCPDQWRKSDVSKHDDEESRWYWIQFENEAHNA